MWDIPAKYRREKTEHPNTVHNIYPTTTVFYIKHTSGKGLRSRYSITSRPYNRHSYNSPYINCILNKSYSTTHRSYNYPTTIKPHNNKSITFIQLPITHTHTHNLPLNVFWRLVSTLRFGHHQASHRNKIHAVYQ